MNRIQLLLTQVSEECHEVGQRAIKAARFGLEETQEGQTENNIQRLFREFSELYGVLEMIVEESEINIPLINREIADEKKIKVDKFAEYSRQQGQLND